jgi:ABC-type Na+ transport system ATPase subunit NatA
MTTAIEVSGVSKSYGGVKANEDISLNVAQGGITGLIGCVASVVDGLITERLFTSLDAPDAA